MGWLTAAAEVLLLGAAHREGVGDTRYSGPGLVVRKLTEMGVDVIVLGVRHAQYLELAPDKVVKAVGKPCAIVDCFSASWTTRRSAATSSSAARSRAWVAATSSASRKACARASAETLERAGTPCGRPTDPQGSGVLFHGVRVPRAL